MELSLNGIAKGDRTNMKGISFLKMKESSNIWLTVFGPIPIKAIVI